MNLGRNIFWNLSAFIWLALLVVFVTPYMVHMLGLQLFGLWAIITAFNGYLTAMDFGLGNALIRFLAAENERRDRKALENYLRSGTSLQVALGVLAAVALWLGAAPLAHQWLRIPPELSRVAVVSIRMSSVAVFLGFVGLAYAAVPAALHRFDFLALRTILLLTAQYLAVVLVLRLGGRLQAVVAVYVAGTAGILLYLTLVARHLLPGINLFPGWHRGSVRELLRFGRMKFPAQLSVTFLQQFDRIVLGVLLPVGQVSFYAVPLRVSQRIGTLAETIASPLYPKVASQLVAGRMDALRQQYGYGVRMVLVAAGGAVAVLGGLAEPLLRVWMGPEFAEASVWPMRILLLAYASSACFTLPSVAADAALRPGIPATFLVVGSLLHAALIWFAVGKWGLCGAAAAVLVGFLIPLVFGIPVIHRRIRALPSLTVVLRESRGVFLAVVVTLATTPAVSRVFHAGTGVAPLVAALGICAALYLALLFLFRGVRRGDLGRILGALLHGPQEGQE